MEENKSPQVPMVQYGQENKNIPGDPGGWKMKDCGNICHWSSKEHYMDFRDTVTDRDFERVGDPRINLVRSYLAELVKNGLAKAREEGTVIRDTAEDLIITQLTYGFPLRIWQLKDVGCRDKKSYTEAGRARAVHEASEQWMTNEIEPIMGRDVEDLMMAQQIQRGQAPRIPMHRVSKDNPNPAENRKKWYKEMRLESCRQFWVKTTREERDEWREKAKTPSAELKNTHLLDQIRTEDKSRSVDSYWTYQRDEAAASQGSIYSRVTEDIIIVFDKNSEVLLCRFRGLFRFLYGNAVNKVDKAVRQWSSMPPLPVPDTSRHMVDDFIRQKHPELDLEKARTLEELNQRHQCVVHYGTWAKSDGLSVDEEDANRSSSNAVRGRINPDGVFPTVDTTLHRGLPRAVVENRIVMAFPIFREKVLGLGSEVVRYLFSTMAPEEYEECCQAYKALPETVRMKMSEPTFSTLAVLGINSFTQRHVDTTDVKFGFASLVALGDYTGGDLCFPQLGIKLPYQSGDCVMFRGAEMEHFVSDWTGYRIFLLYTNHQPVRNYAHRIMGKLPPKPNDDWHPDRLEATAKGVKLPLQPSTEDTNTSRYSLCVMDPLSPEPESLTREELYGPAVDPSDSSYDESLHSNDYESRGDPKEGYQGFMHGG